VKKITGVTSILISAESVGILSLAICKLFSCVE